MVGIISCHAVHNLFCGTNIKLLRSADISGSAGVRVINARSGWPAGRADRSIYKCCGTIIDVSGCADGGWVLG